MKFQIRIFVTMEAKKNYDLAICQSQNKQKASQTCQNINAAKQCSYYDAIHKPFAQ